MVTLVLVSEFFSYLKVLLYESLTIELRTYSLVNEFFNLVKIVLYTRQIRL